MSRGLASTCIRVLRYIVFLICDCFSPSQFFFKFVTETPDRNGSQLHKRPDLSRFKVNICIKCPIIIIIIITIKNDELLFCRDHPSFQVSLFSWFLSPAVPVVCIINCFQFSGFPNFICHFLREQNRRNNFRIMFICFMLSDSCKI